MTRVIDAVRPSLQQRGARASHGTFADAAQFGTTILNCTQGSSTLDALRAAGADNLAGKVLVDVANPLDTSPDRRGTLLFCDSESLDERIQRAFPAARVVKTLNAMWCGLMVNPRLLGRTSCRLCLGERRRRQGARHWNPDVVRLGAG